MADISDIEAAQSTKLVGASSDGTEETPVSSSPDGELKSSDVTLNPGVDTVLNLVAGIPQLLKVGGTAKANRKYVAMQGLDTNIVWGFTNTTQTFDLFRNQFFILPFGVETEIWFDVKSGTGDVGIGEI